jgi:nucleoside-diphosphate-sugar epimerase
MTTAPDTPELVLVTGSAGRIGRAVVNELLAHGQRVRGLDRLPTYGFLTTLLPT